MIDWRKNLKDSMMAMFWMNPHPEQCEIEDLKENIKENIASMIRMTTQKNA